MTAFPPVDVERVLAVPGVTRCVVRACVTSALDLVEAMAREGGPHGAVVVADEQLEGRGRQGRSWRSPVGGLWMAFLARPLTPPAPGAFALRAALGVAGAVQAMLPAAGRIAVKWPNDIMLDNRKAGGILCEATWHGTALQWIAVGIGLNLVNAPSDALSETAAVLGFGARTELLEALLPALIDTREAPPTLTADELGRVAALDWLCGRSLAAPAAGVAMGIQSDGSLAVRGERGVMRFREGTVRLADET